MKEHGTTLVSEVKFYILAGCLSGLEQVNFDCFNVRCLRIESEELHQIVNEMEQNQHERTWNALQKTASDFSTEPELYVFFPLDFQKEFNESNLLECYNIILILFPSDLTIYSIFTFQFFDKKYLYWNGTLTYPFHSTGERIFDNYAIIVERQIPQINSFVKLYKQNKPGIKFLEITIRAYTFSFGEWRSEMAFINLCIALESIVHGRHELSFRIKRNVAILCTENEHEATIVFENLSKIYDLRSDIVHGEKANFNKTSEYLPNLQSLVSKLIVELVKLNVKDTIALDKLLRLKGFGDRKSLYKENEYEPSTINAKTFFGALTELKK